MPDNKEQKQLKELLGKLDNKQLEQVSIILSGPLSVQAFASKKEGVINRISIDDGGYKQFAVDAMSSEVNNSSYQFMKDFGEKLNGNDNSKCFEKLLVKDGQIDPNAKDVFAKLANVKSESTNMFSIFGREGSKATDARNSIKENITAIEKGVAPQSGPTKE